MSLEKSTETYSLHFYVDESGVPDFKRIFSEGDSKLWIQRHLDPRLKNIFKNQPKEVKDVVDKHLKNCQECHNKFGNFSDEPQQIELPDMLDKGY